MLLLNIQTNYVSQRSKRISPSFFPFDLFFEANVLKTIGSTWKRNWKWRRTQEKSLLWDLWRERYNWRFPVDGLSFERECEDKWWVHLKFLQGVEYEGWCLERGVGWIQEFYGEKFVLDLGSPSKNERKAHRKDDQKAEWVSLLGKIRGEWGNIGHNKHVWSALSLPFPGARVKDSEKVRQPIQHRNSWWLNHHLQNKKAADAAWTVRRFKESSLLEATPALDLGAFALLVRDWGRRYFFGLPLSEPF